MEAEKWGWEFKNNILQPVLTTLDPAPESLLKLITCSCTKPCSKACGCIKAGLKCSTICKHCSENDCTNFKTVVEEFSDEEEETEDSEEEEDFYSFGCDGG